MKPDPAVIEPLSVLAVNMTAELAEKMRRLAEQNGRSVQHEIRVALREHVERESADSGVTPAS